MIVIESNADQVFADILAVFQGIPRILTNRQHDFQTAVHWGLTEQFDALANGEVVPTTDDDYVAWDAISPLTEFIRQSRFHTPPGNPILTVTGSLRRGLVDGTTYIIDYQNEAILTYYPSVTQEDRIELHEKGFHVTEPIDIGARAPPRPMLFWGEELGQEMVRILERGIDNLASARGFT